MANVLAARSSRDAVKTVLDQMPQPVRLDPQLFLKGKLPDGLGTGKGVRVCLLDCGVPDHRALKMITNGVNLGPSDLATDLDGLATVGAGFVVANEPERLVGISPDANLYVAKVTDDKGQATDTSVAAGIVWGIVVGANVIIVPQMPQQESGKLWMALEKAVSNNVLVVMEGDVSSALMPKGILTTAGMVFPSSPVVALHSENRFAEVDASVFGPAILGAVAALLLEHAKASEKKVKASAIIKQIKALIAG